MKTLVLIAVSVSAIGQVALGTGAVNGTVRDLSGAYVSGAAVTLTEQSKGLVWKTLTGSAGMFMFASVSAGSYSLEIQHPGFRIYHIRGLAIEVGQSAFVDATLEVGEVNTRITVSTPSAAELDAGSSAIGSTVDSVRVRALPLNGRDFLQLALLVSDAKDLSPANDLLTTYVGPPARAIVLPGALPYAAEYSLNGIFIRGSRAGELAVSPSVAVVDEFKVQEGFLLPDQGVNPAVVNIVTKSGTNELHGEIFEFLRNGKMDARSFFAAAPENLKRNQFGAALGAPLVRNRLWFHAFYEGVREVSAFSASAYTPTAAMFRGDFSATGRAVYDPATYNAASRTRQPFPGGVIPEYRMNPVARNLLAYYGTGSSLSNAPANFFGNPRNTLDDNQGGLRIDAALTQSQQLFAQVLIQDTPSQRPGLFPYSGLLYLNGSELAMLQHTWALRAGAVNLFRFGFLRSVAVGGNEAQADGPVLSSVGIANTFETRGISAINLQGYASFGKANGSLGSRDNSWQLSDSFNYTAGSHTVAVGVQVDYRRSWQLSANSLALGSLSFQPVFTARLAASAQGQTVPAANTGDAFADFLLGYPVSGLVAGLPPVAFRRRLFSPYFQDSWRLSRNLTLNYGLSWFLEAPPRPQGWAREYVHTLDTKTGLLRYAGLGETDPEVVRSDLNNFSPRIGFAWKSDALKATVFRAGGGIYYSEFPWAFAPYPLIGGSPIGGGQSFTNPVTNPIAQYSLGENVFPPAPIGGLTPDYARNLPVGTAVDILAANYRTAYVSQWTAGLQHSINAKGSLDLYYSGSSAHRLPNIFDLSQCRPAANLYCDPATRSYARYGLLLLADGDGNSSSELLTARYRHRPDAGLSLAFEYTFGKVLADSWQSSAAGIYSQISSCRSCAKGPATFDVRHRAVGSAVWDVPVGRGRRFGSGMSRAVALMAGDWTVTGIATFATGQPVVLTAPNLTGSQYTNHLPNRICDGRSDEFSGHIRTNGFLWFDPNCFPLPSAGYFGNSGRTVLVAPGIDNWDIGLHKFVPLGESMRLQFRVEAFNAWNHAQFRAPIGDSGAGANFGRISAARPPRLIQIAVKVLW